MDLLNPVGDVTVEGQAIGPFTNTLSLIIGEQRAGGEHESDEESAEGASPAATWKRAQILPNTSRLKVGDEDELPMQALQANVHIDGFRARVVLDCFYFNDKDRQLEGSFQIRLPNEASLYFFAFGETGYQVQDPKFPELAFFSVEDARNDSTSPEQLLALRIERWDDPKIARMVTREKAAYSYGETVRRSVDPALVEWSGAGVFSARVFPLAPQKLHRIVIGYDAPLMAVGDDLVYRLDLPEVDDVVADLNIAGIPGAQVTVLPKSKPVGTEGRTTYRFEDPAQRTIAVGIENPGTVMLTGRDEETGPYFATRFRPELPASEIRDGVDSGVFLVDVSLSSNPERFNIWLQLLRAMLEQNRDSMQQFAVLFFNIESFWWQDGFVENNEQNTQALLAFAETLSLEGATNLGRALQEAVHPNWRDADAASGHTNLLLMSDGAATWGENDLYTLSRVLNSNDAPALFAYSTGMSGTDMRMLSHLTRESGGAVFSVVGEAQTQRAATAHRHQAWHIEDIKVPGGSDFLLAGRPTSIFPGQELLLVGRGTPQPEVVLTLRRGDQQQQITTRIDHVVASDLAQRTYGQVAVGQLEALTDATEEFSSAFARHFRITGQTCSLLMLETEEDYERYNIKPEEDAFVVKQEQASQLISTALQQAGDLIGDPRATFLAWLEKLKEMPGVDFKLPTGVRLVLEKLPASAFAVTPSSLTCQARTWTGIPGGIQEQLASKELIYDDISTEASRRFQQLGSADALRVLSSLVENQPGDTALARDVGFTAMQWGQGGEAYSLFRRVAASRPYEPQTYQALARCLIDLNQIDLALAYYETALAGRWDERFGDFHNIVGLEYVHLLRRIAAGEFSTNIPEFARARLNSLSNHFQADGETDLLVTIMWNTDGTDVDLHVIDPNKEECYYQHQTTKIGGRLSDDVTAGYGPEMFRLDKAVPGKYDIRVKYFSSDANRTGTRTKVYATVYENWGAPNERVDRKVVTLQSGKEMHNIATVDVGRK